MPRESSVRRMRSAPHCSSVRLSATNSRANRLSSRKPCSPTIRIAVSVCSSETPAPLEVLPDLAHGALTRIQIGVGEVKRLLEALLLRDGAVRPRAVLRRLQGLSLGLDVARHP